MSTLSLPFDTLAYVKRLKEADVPEKQAEAQAEALRAVLVDQTNVQADVATRAFNDLDTKTGQAIRHLEGKTEQAIMHLEAKMATKADIAAAKEDIAAVRGELVLMQGDIKLLKWMFGFMLAGIASLVIKAFF